MHRVIFGCGAVFALLVSLTGCARSSGDSQAPEAGALARSLRAHGVECNDFRPLHGLFDDTELRSLGRCRVGSIEVDINTFASRAGRTLFEHVHDGICPIATMRDDPVTILPYVRGERFVVSVPNEIVGPDDEAASAWRALAPRIAQALGGDVATVDCPALNA
jgi:hypothetical protein